MLSSSGATSASKSALRQTQLEICRELTLHRSIEFPVLNDVKGAFDVVSTTNISAVCDKFQKLAPSKQGGGGQIQGVFHCESDDAQANSDTSGNTSTTGTTGGGSSGSSGSKGGSSAAGVTVNAAMLGLAVVGGLVALL